MIIYNLNIGFILFFYFIFGFIIGIINWIFIVSINTKKNANICISLFLAIFLWPSIILGWFLKINN